MNINDLLKIQDINTKQLYLGALSDITGQSNDPSASGSYLVSGGAVIWRGNLDFTITPATYYILGTLYSSAATDVTLAAADPTNPRIDTFYVDVDGLAGVITGTPAGDPQEPSIDPATQLRLTIAQVDATATVPTDVSNEIIYDENIGTPTEWATSTIGAAVADFADTSDPSNNTIHTTVVGDGSSYGLRYTPASPATINASEDKLIFSIKLTDEFARNDFLSIQFYDGNTNTLLNANLRNGQFGFDGNNTSSYQEIVIPFVAMYPYSSATFTDIDYMTIVSAPQTRQRDYKLDYIYIQKGISYQSGNVFVPHEFKNTIWVDGNGNDATGEKGFFNKPFLTVEAAEDVAQSGDTIIVMPGTYTSANLGKDGVTYKLEKGATLVATGGHLFTDGGSAMSFNINGGELTSSFYRCISISNSASVVNFDVDSIIQTPTGSSNRTLILNSGGTINGIVNEIVNVGTLSVASQSESGGTTNLKFNIATANDLCIVSVSSGIHNVVGNVLKTTCTYTGVSTTVSGLQALSNAKINAKINRYEYYGGNTGSHAIEADTVSGGEIVFTGNIYYEGTSDSVISAQLSGKVILRKTLIEFADTSNNNPIIKIKDSDARVTLDCCVLKNLNQGAAAHGISGAITSTAGVSNLDISETRILLHTTAVGAGAKAINQGGGALNYKAYTDIHSNGAFDGTNLINSTIGIVDSNVKSD